MKKVKVLIPFRVGKKLYKVGQEAKLSEEKIASLLKINCNMFIVLGDAEK